MSFNRIFPALAILVAIISALPFAALAWWPLILLVMGLVFGFVVQEKDQTAVLTIIVLALALPEIAKNLDHIPTVGAYLVTIFTHLAIVIGGNAIANLVLGLKDMIMPAEA